MTAIVEACGRTPWPPGIARSTRPTRTLVTAVAVLSPQAGGPGAWTLWSLGGHREPARSGSAVAIMYRMYLRCTFDPLPMDRGISRHEQDPSRALNPAVASSRLVQMPAWHCHIPCPASPARGSVRRSYTGSVSRAWLAARARLPARLARPGPAKLYRRTVLVMDGRADEQRKDGSQRAVDRCELRWRRHPHAKCRDRH